MADTRVTVGRPPVIVRFGENTAEAMRQSALAVDAAETAQEAAAESLASASVAEAFAGPTFADTAAGLAGTTVGESFAVEDSGLVTVYMHEAGPVATEQRVMATTAALAASGGAALVNTFASGTGAATRTIQAKAREIVTPGDFTSGLVPALAAVRNNDDAFFSGAVTLPNGIVDLTAAEAVPQNAVRVKGLGGTIYRTDAATDIFDASGASFEGSDFSDFRTYGGRDVFSGATVGEIASLKFTDLGLVQFSRDAFSFANGLQSSKFTRVNANSTVGDHGINSTGGINNDVSLNGCSFLNLGDSAIKTAALTQGWWVQNTRVEGGGVDGKAVFDLVGANAVRISGGWYESHHEYLLKLDSASDDGVTIDGILDAGALDGVTLKASLWDVGTNRVIFGTNTFFEETTGPARVFIYGVNKNLVTDSSVAHTRFLRSSEYVIARKRSFASAGDLDFDFATFTRPSAAASASNMQTVAVEMTVAGSWHDGGGVGRWGIWKVKFGIHAYFSSIDDPNTAVVVEEMVGNFGGATLDVEKSGTVTGTTATMQMIFTGINTGLPNFCQYNLDILNLASAEAERFSVSIL